MNNYVCVVENLNDADRETIKKFIEGFEGTWKHQGTLGDDANATYIRLEDTIRFLCIRCTSANSSESELGSSVFAILAKAVPKQFKLSLMDICQMCAGVLKGSLSSITVQHIIEGMSALAPYILSDETAEKTYENSLPFVIQCLQSLAADQPENFCSKFQILDSLASVAPKLLSKNLWELMVFCLETTSNKQFNYNVRLRTAAYIMLIVLLKKKVIVKEKMVPAVIAAVFKIMADDEDNDENSPPQLKQAVIRMMDMLALHIPSKKFIPLLFAYIKPALCGNDPMPRRAAYLSLAIIAEGSSDTISKKHFDQMLAHIKIGIANKAPLVRSAAFYALGQLLTHLQLKISDNPLQLMPIFLENLSKLRNGIRNGGSELKYADQLLYALGTYCEALGTDVVPHLSVLVVRLCEILKNTKSGHVRKAAFSAISAVAYSARQHLRPYFSRVMNILLDYVTSPDLHMHAIDALASVVRTIGREHYLPWGWKTMRFAFILLNVAEYSDDKSAVYNLIASLAAIGKEKFAPIFPQILERIYASVVNDNPSLCEERAEAISALKEFAEHTGTAFLPHAETAFQKVYEATTQLQGKDTQILAIDALTTFVFTLFNCNKLTSANLSLLMCRLAEIVEYESNAGVVKAALWNCFELLRVLKHLAVRTVELRELIFSMILLVMTGDGNCQFGEVGESAEDRDMDQSGLEVALVEAAGHVLPVFGGAMEPVDFNAYFQRIHVVLVQKHQHLKKHKHPRKLRVFIHGCIGACFGPLGQFSANYFDAFWPILSDGLTDIFVPARQNAIFGLGALAFNAGPKAYDAYPDIFVALFTATKLEKTPKCLDAICGAIARIILTNYVVASCEQVFASFLQILPIREDFEENDAVFQCFKMLYIKNRLLIINAYETIMALAVHVLCEKQFPNNETAADAICLLMEFRDDYPEKFHTFLSCHPELNKSWLVK